MQTFRCLFAVFFFMFVSIADAKPTAKGIQAGVAQADITPPIGYRMMGYFGERLSTGIHDPLWAKAMVITDGKEKIAWVFCDLAGLSLNISTNARAQASQKTGIPVANILISSTHSHTGPLFESPIRDYLHELAVAKEGKDPQEAIDYPAFLIEQIVKAIVEANKKMKPATLEAGIAQQYGLSFNRRYHMKNGTVAFNPGQLNPNVVKPAGPIDPDVGIIFLRDQKKQPLGGATIFAVHADCIGGTDYSADYAFYLERTLKGELGTNYQSAFAAGTCGDINQINPNVTEPVKGFEVAEKIGTTLGRAVLQKLPTLAPMKEPSFLVKTEKFMAPLQEISPERLANAREKMKLLTDNGSSFFAKVEAVKCIDIAGKGSEWPMEVQVFRLDKETAVVGLPCEIFVEIGLGIKRDSPFKNTIVMSICNDRPSYVPTKKAFAEGSYEVSNARVKPGVGEMLMETAVKLLKAAANEK